MNVDEAFPGRFLKAADLKGQRVRVEIVNVTLEKIGDNRRLVAELARTDKKLVLNMTNVNTIADLTQSRETDDWLGWKVMLYVGKTQYQGAMVPALRVSDDPASAVPSRAWHEKRAAQAKTNVSPPQPVTEFESAPLPRVIDKPAVAIEDIDDSEVPF